MKMKTTTRTEKWTLADGASFEFKMTATYPVPDAAPLPAPPVISPPPAAPGEVFLNPGDDVVAAARKATKDTVIYLRDGAYGPLRFDGFRPPGTITLRSVNHRKARVQQVLLQNASDITLDGLAIWDDMSVDRIRTGTALIGYQDNRRFHVIDCEFRGHPDVDYFAWDKAKWNAAGSVGGNGSIDGSIKNCLIRGVGFGPEVGSNVVMEGNTLRGFCKDAYRAFDSAKVRNNYGADNFQTSENHNDLFQSFNLGGPPFEGMEIVGNTLVSWTGPKDHPLRPESIMCQGIGFFDGFWNRLVIRDNLIVTDHWHGLSIYGATNSIIERNLVLNIYGKDAPHLGRPWVQLLPHKDGRPSDNVIFQGNKAFAVSSDPKNTRITQTGNVNLTPAETQALLDANAARIAGPQ